MDHKQILEMIENVSPYDTAKLDEIDARVWCYFNTNLQYVRVSNHGFNLPLIVRASQIADSIEYNSGHHHIDECPRYTRSRDALKAIRPEGWAWSISISDCEVSVCRAGTVIKAEAETETLAELHAIISAISWERENGNLG